MIVCFSKIYFIDFSSVLFSIFRIHSKTISKKSVLFCVLIFFLNLHAKEVPSLRTRKIDPTVDFDQTSWHSRFLSEARNEA